MADESPLIVPIVVEALVVNDPVRAREFQRWQMQYNSAQYWASVEPDPFSGHDASFNAPAGASVQGTLVSDFYNGVYLKWRLPSALRQGIQHNVHGTTIFPMVPNRWLVVRYSGTDPSQRQATAWIIQSDAITTAQSAEPTSYSLLASTWPASTPPRAQLIGASSLLDGQGFTDPAPTMFLTALGAGNPAFCAYQPYNNNVFSFMDPLNAEPAMLISYAVLGWYSDSTQDPLAAVSSSSLAAVLATLDWTTEPGTDSTATASWSVYFGTVTGVNWQNTSSVEGGPPRANEVAVAVGNTSAEAITALVTSQLPSGDTGDAELFEAFLYNLLRIYEQPDGAALVADAVLASSFQSLAGGYRWVIVDAPGAGSPPPATELANEQTWLAALNQAQAAYDEAARKLFGLQSRLYDLWWKYQYWPFANPANTTVTFTQTDLQNQLDPTQSASLASVVAAAITDLAALQSKIPWGTKPAALDKEVEAYATANNLPATRLLKRENAAPFYLPNNPVVLLQGAGAPDISGSDGTLVCRFSSQLVTGFNYAGQSITSATANLTIPSPNLGTLSGVPWDSTLLGLVLDEFFFLDPLNASAVAAALGDTSQSTIAAIEAAMSDPAANAICTPPDPQLEATPWPGQPWRPLFLMWSAEYCPIDFGPVNLPNWTFEGGRYTWNGSGARLASPLSLQGRILLTPQATMNLQTQVQNALTNNPDLDATEQAALTELSNLLGQDDNWDFLSQPLNGFNEQLAARLVGAYPSLAMSSAPVTTPPLSDLIGDAGGFPPKIGNLPSSRPQTNDWLPWRCGQFVFTALTIVDEWGQALTLIDPSSYEDLKVCTPPDLTPAQSLWPDTPDCAIQLLPALPQPARLDLDLGAVLGWVLPNHLDRALAIYDAAGVWLGELLVTVDVGGDEYVRWRPAPSGAYATLKELAAASPSFGRFLDVLSKRDVTTFRAFLDAVDETLWTIQPADAALGQNLAELIGRPLAFVGASVSLSLDGPPQSDPAWQSTFSPRTELIGYPFAAQLGDPRRTADGLIGYFADDSFATFNVSPRADARATDYLQPIGHDGNYLYLTCAEQPPMPIWMLIDPRATVHASTGILPVVTASLPAAQVSTALAAMMVAFRVGPLLIGAQTTKTPGQGSRDTLLMPLPAGSQGHWWWLELDEQGISSYQLAPADTSANLSSARPILRNGVLELSAALANDDDSEET